VEPEQLDLTGEQPTEDQLIILPQRDLIPPAAVQALEVESLDRTRENTRASIAYYLIYLLFLTVGASIALPVIFSIIGFVEDPTAVIQDIGSTVLTPIVGLIGAVIGFYFGGQRAGAQTPPRLPGEGGGR
jgi:hypothetical protein